MGHGFVLNFSHMDQHISEFFFDKKFWKYGGFMKIYEFSNYSIFPCVLFQHLNTWVVFIFYKQLYMIPPWNYLFPGFYNTTKMNINDFLIFWIIFIFLLKNQKFLKNVYILYLQALIISSCPNLVRSCSLWCY